MKGKQVDKQNEDTKPKRRVADRLISDRFWPQ